MKWTLPVAVCACVAGVSPADERRAVPSYTNEDLDRMRSHRDETGVNSSPAPTGFSIVAAPAPAPGRAKQGAPSGEAFWRRETERHHGRLAALRRDVAALEQKLAERQRKPGVRPYSDPAVERYRARLSELRERTREEEARFLDRARREGALPGWLR